MKAKDKQDFLDNWEDYVNQFDKLGQSTDDLVTWQEIKWLMKDMRELVHKVAEEAYG